MMKGQTSRGGRIWTTIGGFTGLLAIVSIVIAYLQLRQADKASLSSDFTQRAIRKPDLWYHDGDHAVLMRSNLVCHDVHFDPIQPRMRPI
jgi:hypothetical protein